MNPSGFRNSFALIAKNFKLSGVGRLKRAKVFEIQSTGVSTAASATIADSLDSVVGYR